MITVNVLVLITSVTMATGIYHHWKCDNCTCTIKDNVQYIDCREMELTHLPFPDQFGRNRSTSIYIVDNTIPNVPENLFANFTNFKLVFVRLRSNKIVNISENVFQNLPHLKGLDLSWNDIEINQVGKALTKINNTHFRDLNISRMYIKSIPDDFFTPFVKCRGMNISIHHNNLTELNLKAFGVLPSINFIDLDSNRISKFSSPQIPCSAKILKLDNNVFSFFPNFCKNDSEAYFPRLEVMRFQWNFMRDLNPDYYNCLRSLKEFHLNGNLFSTLKQGAFSELESIDRITLSETFSLQHVYRGPFNNSKLQRVFFRKNFLYTQNGNHRLDLFEGCTSMKLLNMADNILDKTSDEKFEELFKPLSSLRTLIMGGCRLTRIPPAVTKYLLNLQELVLYNNRITSWPDGALDSLKYLDKIYMRQNVITVISEFTLPTNFSQIAKRVDFSNNPFQCSCDNKWFVEWMNRKPQIFKVSPFNPVYTCTSPAEYKNFNLTTFPMSDSFCLMDTNSKIITLTISTVLIFLIVAVLSWYNFQWQIRYLVFMMRYQKKEMDTGTYEYDAFVAHCEKDLPWVKETLMPVLEGKSKMKLCIHQRDFEVGRFIVDNIVDCVDKSRCLLIILSNEFAKSSWCQFELSLIQRHVIENNRRVLVLVMLEELQTRYVTKSMSAMMSTTTYLLWGEDEYAQTAFFNRLRMLLRKPQIKSRRLSV